MLAPSASPAAGSAMSDALVLLDSHHSWKPWTQSLKRSGGRVTVGFPPDAFLVQGSPQFLAGLAGPGIRVYSSEVPDGDLAGLSGTARLAAAVWNRRLLAPAGMPPVDLPRLSEPDALEPPASRGKVSEGAAIAGAPTGAGFYDTSEFLEGSVAVGLILPESDGAIDMNRENWTTAEIQEVVTGVQAALAFHTSREPKAHLSFYLVVYDSIQTGYEPIRRGSYTTGEQDLWITECMDSLGFTTGDIFYRTRAFDNALRDSLGTDWGITMFLVDSSRDADGRFADQTYAYSYIGGPFLVMTYDNWNWGIQNMDAIAAHETLHQFYALDEYLASPCTEASGYLGTQNQNSNTVAGCNLNTLCLMRDDIVTAFDADSVCWFTRGQIGWRDTDGDSILDILD